MRISKTILAGAAALAFSTVVLSQTRIDRTFSATGASCDEVTWSQETLERYPRIASACRDVLERDGKYYVHFEGEVERVMDRGQQIRIDFEGGDRLTLTPPENLSIHMNGRPTSAADLRPGDQLNFYVPQDQLVATFFAGEPETAPVQEVEISQEPEEQYAAAQPESRAALPGTASSWPLLGLAGLVLMALGAVLTIRRRSR